MKSLNKEVNFGKAIARVTVTAFVENVYLDGQVTGEKIITTDKVEIVAGGNVVEKGNANILEYNILTDTIYEKNNLNTSKKYTKVGGKAITQGEETGIEIKNVIEEMKKELADEFEVKTEKEIKEEEVIKEAQKVVELAKQEGIENLKSATEIKNWRKKYIAVNNEGGEGYVPIKVSKEQYQQATKVLQKQWNEWT